MSEDANKSLELQYAHTYHNLLDKIINRRFTEVLPIFRTEKEEENNFVNKVLKDDLIAYGAYATGYPIEESENMLVEDFLKRGEEALLELDAWLKLWYVKWLYRTKIVSNKEFNGMHRIVSKFAEHARMIEIEPSLMEQLRESAVETLVQEKEYACTRIMARDLVIYALREEYKNISKGMSIPDQLRLMTAVIRRTRSVASMTGALVFIKVK